MILTEAKKNFLRNCELIVNLSKNTLRAYESDIDDIHRFLGYKIKLEDIRAEHLRSYIEHLRLQRRLKETTVKRRLASLKLLFIWAKRENLIEDDPFRTLNERIRLPKRLPRALDRSDRECLRKILAFRVGGDDFDAVRQKTAIHLLLDTGIRVGELVAIRLCDLSLADESLLIHGKGDRQRFVYVMQKPLYKKMEKYLAYRQAIQTSNDQLFVLSNGNPLGPVKVRAELRSLCREAGIVRHVTPHMLRHTCATQWLESGMDIRYVQKLLGHQSISTTEIYTHVSDQGLRDALFKATGGFRR